MEARISLCAAGLFSEDDVLRAAATADEGMFSFRFAPVSDVSTPSIESIEEGVLLASVSLSTCCEC